MTKRQTKHAEQVVEHFKELLSESGRQHVGEKHFEQLALLVESAIDAAVLEESGAYIGQLEEIISRMKRSTERFDAEAESPQAAVQ